jgi:ubiquinone/menaquinone biosynthesis C-methylase UbiE
MLGIARRRAQQLGCEVDLRGADALALPFPDAFFGTVVGTFSLCAVPDKCRAVSEANRVRRPARLMPLADHIAGAAWPVRAIQRLLEVFAVPLQGEHYTPTPPACPRPAAPARHLTART